MNIIYYLSNTAVFKMFILSIHFDVACKRFVVMNIWYILKQKEKWYKVDSTFSEQVCSLSTEAFS